MRAIYATDLSAASDAAIENETCLDCLERIGVEEIHLLTVVPSNVHAGMPGMDLEERRERGLEAYRSVMEEAGFRVETHIVRGTPYRRINGVAETVRADLAVVGSRGQSPLANRVIGSTARNLARTIRLLPEGAERRAQIDTLRAMLEDIFAVKQENRRREIERLQRQIRELQENLQRRAQMRDRMIDRHLRQLIDSTRGR